MEMTEELNWASAHQEEFEPYAGKWVAILDKKIIGVADTAREALEAAKKKSKKTPFLVKVPRKDEGMYVL